GANRSVSVNPGNRDLRDSPDMGSGLPGRVRENSSSGLWNSMAGHSFESKNVTGCSSSHAAVMDKSSDFLISSGYHSGTSPSR
ncbi:unnamed protein product, partial [Dovyalis caffra]